jgi:hypothetical protein
METIPELVARGVEHLIGRFSGPLNFRLFVMPTVVTILAVRAGLRDARGGHPPFFWTILTNPAGRQRALRSALKDIGRVFIMAVVLDTTYQLYVLRAFYPLQLLIVVVGCAIMPYVLIRGPVSRIARPIYKKKLGAIHPAAGGENS